MRLPKKDEKGFTLVELLIVLAILAVLAAVVIPNVTGMFGRGASQAYDTDQTTIQTSVATFYFDTHKYDGTNTTWNAAGGENGHYYPVADPTDSLNFGDITLGTTEYIYNNQTVYEVLDSTGNLITTAGIGDAEMAASVIWMGLLVNSPGTPMDYDADTDSNEAGDAAPLATEKGPYLNELPESSNVNNSSIATGSYTWVIGKDGKVYGCTFITPDSGGTSQVEGWYAGFNSTYP